MERIGIIDLGSNSVRLVIIHVTDNGAYYQKENLKETVRLVGTMDENGVLAEPAIDYAVETIRLFINFCKARKVDHIIGVATAAARRATNQQVLIDRIRKTNKIEFQVLSGQDEAHLGYLGCINTMPQTSGLMADLGGGSLKLVSYADRISQSISHQPFGAVTLSNTYQTHDKPSAENLKKMNSFLLESFSTIPWVQGNQPIIGVGGTFRSLARIIRKQKEYLPDITDAFEISLEDVVETYNTLAGMTLEQRFNVPGLEQPRADIIVAGVAAICCLLKASNRSKLIVSTTSIRDGLLYQYLNRYTGDPIVLSVLTHHIDNLINYYHLEEDHLRRVSNFAVTLFDQLAPIHQFNSYERRLLLVASLLHEIGVVIGMEGRDKHTLYMLLNAPLHGLTHRERVIAAFVAASHDDNYMAGIESYVHTGPLNVEDKALIAKLASILQIAHSLDRCHTGIVTQVRATTNDSECILNILAKTGAELEINDAKRKTINFEELFKRKLQILHR